MRTSGGPGSRRTAEFHPTPVVHTITGARRGLTEDVSARQRRYLWSMGLRTACFVLAVVSTGWIRWGFIAGAVLLPYFAVVIANGGREPTRDLPTTAIYDPRRVLEPPKATSLEPPR